MSKPQSRGIDGCGAAASINEGDGIAKSTTTAVRSNNHSRCSVEPSNDDGDGVFA
ncbi:hypothetical protein ACWPKO_30890 (plasmid) [Coraliomargarita sp. W4R53]